MRATSFQFCLPKAMLEALQKEANAKHMPIAQLLRKLIRDYLEEVNHASQS